jgi:hypothetical protein
VTDAKEPEAESISILEDFPVSRRAFLRLSIASLAGLSLFVAPGCGGSQDGGGGDGDKNGKKDKGGGGGGY